MFLIFFYAKLNMDSLKMEMEIVPAETKAEFIPNQQKTMTNDSIIEIDKAALVNTNHDF